MLGLRRGISYEFDFQASPVLTYIMLTSSNEKSSVRDGKFTRANDITTDNTIDTIEIAGNRLAYSSSGTGAPVLLVHGITTYSFIWRRIVPLLSDRYRVISLDLLGCGRSDKPLDADYSLRHHATLIKQFMEQLGYDQYHFVGHDVGGGVGQILAASHPETLLDLTLINSVGHDFWPVQPIIAMRTPIIRQLAMATLDFGAFRLVVKRGMYHKNKLTDELMKLFWKPMKTREGRKAFLHFADCLNNRHLIDIEKKLQQLDLPVLIIRGDADAYLSGAISDKLKRDIPGSILSRIDTGGHFIQEDEPESIANELHSFFQTRKG
jgi:pimeloyl-ACP methyl ester carboxylesterase